MFGNAAVLQISVICTPLKKGVEADKALVKCPFRESTGGFFASWEASVMVWTSYLRGHVVALAVALVKQPIGFTKRFCSGDIEREGPTNI